MLPCRDIFAVSDTVLLHMWVHLCRRNMTVLRNFLTRYTAWHLRIRRLVQFIFVSAVYHNALTNCAALLSPRGPSLALWAIHLVPRLRGFNRMCTSRVSDPANRFRKTRKKKSSAVPLFRSGHMSAICARLGSKGKVGVQRGRETAGVPSSLPPRRAPRRSRHLQAAHPSLRFSENSPPRQGEPANAVRAPRLSGAGKSCRPSRANRLRGSCTP